MLISRIGCFLALTALASTQVFHSQAVKGESSCSAGWYPSDSLLSPPSPSDQLRLARIGRVTAVVQISSTCCSAPAAWECVRRLQQEYADKGVDILVRGTDPDDTFEKVIDEFQPEWPPTDQSPPRPFKLEQDGGFRAGPGYGLLFGRDGYLLAADFHTSELELRLKAVFSR